MCTMSKKLISYKVLYYLSLIPFLGLLIAWICSWLNIYHRTDDRKYVFLHFLIWIFPMCIVGVIVVICTMTFMVGLSSMMKTICGLVISYVACLIMSISCIRISKWLISKYDQKIIK